jgi:hypothetical protein
MLRQPLEAALHAPVAVVNKPAALDRPPLVQGLLKRVEHEAGVSRPAHPPANNATRISVDQRRSQKRHGQN